MWDTCLPVLSHGAGGQRLVQHLHIRVLGKVIQPAQVANEFLQLLQKLRGPADKKEEELFKRLQCSNLWSAQDTHAHVADTPLPHSEANKSTICYTNVQVYADRRHRRGHPRPKCCQFSELDHSTRPVWTAAPTRAAAGTAPPFVLNFDSLAKIKCLEQQNHDTTVPEEFPTAHCWYLSSPSYSTNLSLFLRAF